MGSTDPGPDRRAVIAGACLAAGLFEAIRVLLSRRFDLDSVGLGAFALGLWALLGLIGLWSWRSRGESDADWGMRAAATAICLAVTVVIAAPLVADLGARVGRGRQPWLAAGLSALVAVVLLGFAPALACALGRVVPRALRRPAVVIGVGLVGCAAVTWPLAAYDVRLVAIPIALAGAALGLIPRARRVLGIGGLVGVVALPIGALLTARAAPPAVRSAAPAGLLLGWTVQILQRVSDRDGDGHGALFGGGDCDDANPKRNPGAREIMGNGIDENCRDGDLTTAFRYPTLPAGKRPKDLGNTPHIVLIVLDAVRDDKVTPELMPNLHAYMQRGTRFTRAFAPSAVTRASVPALLTGRWVSHTNFADGTKRFRMDRRIDVLPEQLARRGYRTALVTPAYPFRHMVGLKRGFADRHLLTYKQASANKGRSAPEFVVHMSELFDSWDRRPGFVYAHFIDAHAPYRTPGATQVDRYHSTLQRLDRDLAPLLERLDALAKERSTLVVITADHGEGLGEHGTFFHGFDLHQTVIDVPLALIGPGIPAQTVDTPVDLLDLGVTLATAGGTRLRRAKGSPLWGVMAGEPAPKRQLYSAVRVLSQTPYRVMAAVVEWPYKLHTDWSGEQRTLYNLAIDPEEQHDVFDAEPAIAERLMDLLTSWAAVGNGPAGTAPR